MYGRLMYSSWGVFKQSRCLSCCHTEMDGSWIALYPRPPEKYTVLSLVFFHDNRRPVDFCGEYS